MEEHLSLRKASRILGVSVRTIQRWDRAGLIRCVRTPGGRRRIPQSEIDRILGINRDRLVVCYARVSSHTQRDDLGRQVDVLKSHAEEISDRILVIRDIGSGLNEKRKGFRRLLRLVADGVVSHVLVTYRDRLVRFGFETLSYLFSRFGARVVVLYDRCGGDSMSELVDDLVSIIVHFAGRIYGRRSHLYKRSSSYG